MVCRHLAWVVVVTALAARADASEFVWLEGESSLDTTFNHHNWYEDTSLDKRLMSPGVPDTGPGDWLAHYVTGNPANTAYARWSFTLAEGGSYTWWLRTNPINATLRYAVDAAPLQPLDVTDYREVVNIVQGIDIRWLAWVKVGSFALAPGNHSVTIEVAYNAARNESHGGVDALCLTNFPWEPAGTLQPGQEVNAPAPGAWFTLHAGDDPYSPSSLTDLSSLVPAPAGKDGPVQRAGADLVFRNRPNERIKFWGLNLGTPPASPELMDQQARFYAKYGVNLVRIHPVESTLGVLQKDPGSGQRFLDPAALDTFDRWFSAFKARGIYLDLSFFYPHVITADDAYPLALYNELPNQGAGKSSSGMVAFMTELQDAEWAWLQVLLNHVNPYTGLAYKNDPALAIVEVHNEDSIFWHAPLNPLSAGTPYPQHTARLKQLWRDWVKARYVSDAVLAAAWGAGMRPGDSVDNIAMDIYGAWQMTATGPDWGAGPRVVERQRLGDFIRFLAETQRGYYERRIAQVKGLGFQGLAVTTAWMAGGPAAQAANLWSDDAGDAIDRHNYFGGGAGSYYVQVGAVNNQTHLDRPGQAVVPGFSYDAGGGITVPLWQSEDKPAILSEWSQMPPNQWKAEAAPLFAFYGLAIGGGDVSLHFAGGLTRMGSGWPSNLRGPDPWVSETPHYFGQFPALVYALKQGHIKEASLAAARRLPLAAIFQGFDSLSQDLASGGYPGDVSLRTPPEVGAIGRVGFAAENGLAAPARLDWSLYWDQAARTITSVTGELTWDYGRKLVTLHGEKTQAVIGWTGGMAVDLPGVQVATTTPFVSLIFTPLDDLPLVDSEHILVTALARDAPWGAEYSPDGSQLLKLGGPPLLLEPVEATLSFKGASVTSARVVDLHGVPTAVDVQRNGNAVTIDGRYATYYYEIKKAAPARCLVRSAADQLTPPNPSKAQIFLALPGADGVSLDPAAAYAQVPYLCPFASGQADPEAVLALTNRPLIYYQMTDLATPLKLRKDQPAGTVRANF